MEFDKWIKRRMPGNSGRNTVLEMGLRKAFEAGVKIERKACAKICDAQANEPECPERAKYCADAIRERSNV